MTTKLPSFQFYPGDWKKHPDLNRATKAEKGMLMDLLCLLWETQERGIFVTAEAVWTDEDIASAAGGDSAENLLLLRGLLRKGILHRNKSEAVYSPRMVREEDARKQAVKDGKKGGNPRLKGGVKGYANPKPTPSSSSSSSVSKDSKASPLSSGGGKIHFKPPTAEEVAIEGRLRGYAVNAEKFVAHYDAVDWKDAQGRQITNWRALLTGWKIRDQENPKGGKIGSHSGSARSRADEPRIVD